MPETKKKDEALLEEIRRRFDICVQADKDIRTEGELDMRALSVNGPWDPLELKARQEAKRPCPHHDQLRQHRNKLIGELRLNKRAIEITPTGEGANDETARLRAGRIRQIEYESNATDAYRGAFESMCDRSYGFFKVTTAYKDAQSTNLKIRIKGIANPDTVYLDPDTKDYYDPDCEGSARYGFLLDTIPIEDFKDEYPSAEITSFGESERDLAPAWFKDNKIQVAEYWRVETRKRRKLILEDPDDPGGRPQFEDELPNGAEIEDKTLRYADGLEIPVKRERHTTERKIVQYITNGVEILHREEWPGKWIPIVPMFGPEQWSSVDGKSKRMLYSLIRMARSPMMSFDFALANEEEVLGMTPKVPWVGYRGQFTDKNFATAHKIPVGYLEAEIITDGSGQTVLPLPQRTEYEPPIQALELAKQAFSVAIQNAIGMPSAEHKDRVAKSGKALEAMDRESDLGTFHFIDNHDRAVQFAGRIIDDLLPKVEDTDGREEAIREADGKTTKVKLNTVDEKSGKRIEYGDGHHEVTVSVGPSYQSERQRTEAALETLLKTLPPELSVRFLDLLVKLMNLGPIGDQIVDRITPQEFKTEEGQQPVPPEVAQKMQEQQAVIQELQAVLKELQFKLEAKQVETEGDIKATVIKTQSAEKIAGVKAGSDQAKTDKETETDKAVEQIKGEFALVLQQMRDEMEQEKLKMQAEVEKFRARNAAVSQDRDISASERSQEREIQSRPPDSQT